MATTLLTSAMESLGSNLTGGGAVGAFTPVAIIIGVWYITELRRSIVDSSSKSSSPSTTLVPASATKEKNYTRIHRKWYELSRFDHPGGAVALGLAHGRDATALFESHHYFVDRPKLLAILSKYEVPPEEAKLLTTLNNKLEDDDPNDLKDVEEDGFTNDLRRLVNDYFGKIAEERGISTVEASKATPGRKLLCLALVSAWLATFPGFLRGEWLYLFLNPVLCWVSLVNYWHDANHFGLSANWRINAVAPYLNPYLSSPWIWMHQHNVGHHVYTNVERKDPDLYHFTPYMRDSKDSRWRPAHASQARWWNFLTMWSVGVGIGVQLRNSVRAVVHMSYNKCVPIRSQSTWSLALFVLGRLLYVYIAYLWPFQIFSVPKAAVWSFVPNAIFGLCFMVNTQINHLVEHCADAFDSNFYKNQVVTAQDFGHGSTFCFYFSGGLNYQIEHHLFPCINHCHLPGLSKGVRRICEKYGITYNITSGYRESIRHHLEHKAEMAVKPQN
ncbi:hypothetical protein ACHAWF_016294 [Thalassiosira exigua]